MSKTNSGTEMEDIDIKNTSRRISARLRTKFESPKKIVPDTKSEDDDANSEEADALALEIEEEVVFDIEEEDMDFLTDEDYKDLQGFDKSQNKSHSKTKTNDDDDEITIVSEYTKKDNCKNDIKGIDLSDNALDKALEEQSSRLESNEINGTSKTEGTALLDIPGLSFIIGIKPDNSTTKASYDCVMCSSEKSPIKFTGPEMKNHVYSRQHILNVMLVENITLYEKYKEDIKTSSKLLLNEILKYELTLEPQKIVPSTLEIYKQQREKVLSRLRELLLSQLDRERGFCATEKKEAFKKSTLHITSMEKNFLRKITKKQKNGEVSSVVKINTEENGDSATTQLYLTNNSTSTGNNYHEKYAMKKVIAAKDPNIVGSNISKNTLNSATEEELLIGEGLILKRNKTNITLFDKKQAESFLPIVSSRPIVHNDEANVLEKEVLKLIEKEVLDRAKLIEIGTKSQETKVKYVKKYSDDDLIDVKQFVPMVGQIRKDQKERIPNKIVLVTDDRDNFDVSLVGFNEKVDVMKIPGLNYTNAFPSIKIHPNFGKGTLFIISCGTHDLLLSVVLQDCLQASCPFPQTMLSIPLGEKNVNYLIEKALALNKNILDATKNDMVLFCGLIPVHVAKYNKFTINNRPCKVNHPAFHEPPAGLPLFKEYESAVLMFNKFTKLHAQMLGYTPWDLDQEYFITKQSLLPNAYNLTEMEVTSRTNLAKQLCDEILLKFSITASCALGQMKKSNSIFKYDQVVIVTDERYTPYLKTLKNEFTCVEIPDYKIEDLESQLLGKIDFSIGKTLIFLVVGIHSVAKDEPAKFCVGASCDDPLTALTPFSPKKWAKLFEKIITKHQFFLKRYGDSLPDGSNICVLPPLPIAVIGKQSHRGLHEMHFECKHYKVINNLGDFSRWYPIWIDKVIDYSRSTLVECDPNNKIWSGQKFKVPAAYREVNLVMRKGGPITYNSWKNTVKQLANTASKDLKQKDVNPKDLNFSNANSCNLKPDYLIFIGPASSFVLLPALNDRYTRWNFEDIVPSDKLVKKIKNLNKVHMEGGYERFLFIVISDASMMGVEEDNRECYKCEQQLTGIKIPIPASNSSLVTKIKDSIAHIKKIWYDIRKWGKFNSKIIIAPFTPRQYINFSNFKLFHSRMHDIVKEQVATAFLKGGTQNVWEDSLKTFAEEWSKLGLLVQKESREIMHLKNIESTFKLQTLTTCKDISSKIYNKVDSAVSEWQSCINALVMKGWVASVDISESDKRIYPAPYSLPPPSIQHGPGLPYTLPSQNVQHGAVNDEFGMVPGRYDSLNNSNPYLQPADHQLPPTPFQPSDHQFPPPPFQPSDHQLPPTPFQPSYGDQYPRMHNPNSVQTYSAPPLNYPLNQPPLPVPPPHRPMIIQTQNSTVPFQHMAALPQRMAIPHQHMPIQQPMNILPQHHMPVQPPLPPTASSYDPYFAQNIPTNLPITMSNPPFSNVITSGPDTKRGHRLISESGINRNLDEIIQFAKTLKRSCRKPADFQKPSKFENTFIVGTRELISPLLECNIKSTMIYHNFTTFDDSDIQNLLYKMGNIREKSVCCLVFDLSIITSKLVMSPACFRHACQQPLLVTTLEPGSLNNDKELDMLFYSKIQSISKFIRKLTKHISVIVLPFSPTKFYCEDIIAQSHQDSHTISKLGFPVVYGPQAKWVKAIQSLNLSWNNLMQLTNKNFDSESLISNYIASNPSTFLMLKNVTDFVTTWIEPDIWKAFAETFLQSLVPMKICYNDKKTSISSWPDKTSVIVSQVSSSIPFAFFMELFKSADRNVDIIQEKGKFILNGMTPGRANLLVKKLNNYHIADTVLLASLVGKIVGENPEFNLIQSLYISTIFEQIYLKWKPEIINNLIKKVNEVPNIATLKTMPCEKGMNCSDSKVCIYHHGSHDMRRNPFLNDYTDTVCLKAKRADGLCREGLYCRLSHNMSESKYLPYKYQVKMCPSGTSESCSSRELCTYAHKDSPEMLYTSDWEDLIMVGPQESLKFFTGAIRAFSKVEQVHRCNIKVLMISPSSEFLDIAIKASADLLKIYGLTVSSFYSSNASSMENDTSIPDSCQVLVGNPSAFVNLSANIFREKKGTIIIDDIQKIMQNERYRDDMRLFFHNVGLSKVFVCSSYDPRLVGDISSIVGSQLKLVYHPETDDSNAPAVRSEKRSFSPENSDYRNKKPRSESRTSSLGNNWPSKSSSSGRRSRSKERVSKDRYNDSYSSHHNSARHVRLSPPPPPVIHLPTATKQPYTKFDKHEDLSKRFGGQLYEEYKRMLTKAQQEFEMDFSVYINMPELYPNYKTHYNSFNATYKMQHVRNDDPNKDRLWKLFWRSKFEDIKREDWEAKQTELVAEFDKKAAKNLNDSRGFREVEAPRNYNNSQPVFRNTFSQPKVEPFSFEETLSLIESLSNVLGFLGPSVTAIIKSCRDKGTATKEAYQMFTESENVMLVNMVLEKLKSQFQSVSGETRLIYEKAIDWIPKFLIEAKKGPPRSASTNLDSIKVDLQAIARASVGKGSKFALDLIKTALAYEGVENPTKEQINGLFLKVCEIHFSLAIDD